MTQSKAVQGVGPGKADEDEGRNTRMVSDSLNRNMSLISCGKVLGLKCEGIWDLFQECREMKHWLPCKVWSLTDKGATLGRYAGSHFHFCASAWKASVPAT